MDRGRPAAIYLNDYFSVEECRKKFGYAHKNSVLDAIREKRMEPPPLNFYGTWMILKTVLIMDKRITHGRTIGQAAIKRRLREQAKEKGYTDERILGLEDE
jgi:hypothetical protein